MGKVKIKKKDTRIDMTAMSDVTVLLLTFFMLTSTFLQKEPITVITPPSVSVEKVPDQNLLSVLISPTGKVFLAVTGSKDSTFKSETVREDLLKNMTARYNSLHPEAKVTFTNREIEAFAKTGSFGVPFRYLKEWLDIEDITLRDKVLEGEEPLTTKDGKKVNISGIPINMNEDPNKPNEFQMWVQAAYNSMDEELKTSIIKGKGIAIKADQSTPYSVVNVVMDNLQTIKMNKFSLMTALKAEEE